MIGDGGPLRSEFRCSVEFPGSVRESCGVFELLELAACNRAAILLPVVLGATLTGAEISLSGESVIRGDRLVSGFADEDTADEPVSSFSLPLVVGAIACCLRCEASATKAIRRVAARRDRILSTRGRKCLRSPGWSRRSSILSEILGTSSDEEVPDDSATSPCVIDPSCIPEPSSTVSALGGLSGERRLGEDRMRRNGIRECNRSTSLAMLVSNASEVDGGSEGWYDYQHHWIR